MKAQPLKKTPAEDKGQGRTPPAAKGCCYKRSQCIEKYCDCYQSMMVCTQFCRCVGCQNTEAGMAVEPRTTSRKSSAMKGDRAAAKEGFNIPVPPISNHSVPVTIGPVPPPTVMAPININIIPIPREAMETDEVPTPPDDAMDLQFPQVERTTTTVVMDRESLIESRLIIHEFANCFIEICEELLKGKD